MPPHSVSRRTLCFRRPPKRRGSSFFDIPRSPPAVGVCGSSFCYLRRPPWGYAALAFVITAARQDTTAPALYFCCPSRAGTAHNFSMVQVPRYRRNLFPARAYSFHNTIIHDFARFFNIFTQILRRPFLVPSWEPLTLPPPRAPSLLAPSSGGGSRGWGYPIPLLGAFLFAPSSEGVPRRGGGGLFGKGDHMICGAFLRNGGHSHPPYLSPLIAPPRSRSGADRILYGGGA